MTDDRTELRPASPEAASAGPTWTVPEAPGGVAAVHGADLTLGVTRFGPRVLSDGTAFRLWAPAAEAVDLLVEDAVLPMEALPDGWFEAVAPGVGPGTRYAFRIGETTVADPASRLQEDDVEGRSVVTRPALAWRNRRLGRPWTEMVIAEVHVGTATPEGTFRALAARLPHFAEAGYTAIQLMPVADFPGARGWGYDGVLPFAPERAYGSPEDLVDLIQAAHGLGLAMLLDVVYNHFGPVGNSLPAMAPDFFAAGTHTPWGPAIDFTRPQVRRFFLENALMWVDDYGFDGLRFDAVHAFQEPGRGTFLAELAETLNRLEPRPFLVLENEHNESSLLQGAVGADPDRFTAQWNDDFHHVFHVSVTGEQEGYYVAYAEETARRTARVLAQGFDYQGDPSPIHHGKPRGEPSAGLHPTAFVSFVQNHDQIGNRALGERLTALAGPDAVRLLRFATLLAPQVPMLFMGEEFESRRPFQFFCDYTGEMAEAVRRGRRAEFASFSAFSGETVPDPISAATFEASKLDWDRVDGSEGRAAIELTREWADLRRRHVVPLLATDFEGADAEVHGALVSVVWRFAGGRYGLAVNLSDTTCFARVPAAVAVASVGQIAPGDGHWVFEAYSGALWTPR